MSPCRLIRLCVAALVVAFFSAVSEAQPLREIRILAKLGNQTITSRTIFLDLAYEAPQQWKLKSAVNLLWNASDRSKALQRVLLEKMIVAENDLVRGFDVSTGELQEEKNLWIRKIGTTQSRDFFSRLEVSDAEWTEVIRRKLVVRKSLADQVRLARQDKSQNVSLWAEKLRSRYRVEMLESEP